MKFLVPNYSCLQNPWLGGYRPQIPVLSVLNWICWTPSRAKFLCTPLHTRRSSTQSDKYQVSYWYSYFSWWWAYICPKHVENRNKHTKKELCTRLILFARLYRDARSIVHQKHKRSVLPSERRIWIHINSASNEQILASVSTRITSRLLTLFIVFKILSV
jgi:hypothetical protein